MKWGLKDDSDLLGHTLAVITPQFRFTQCSTIPVFEPNSLLQTSKIVTCLKLHGVEERAPYWQVPPEARVQRLTSACSASSSREVTPFFLEGVKIVIEQAWDVILMEVQLHRKTKAELNQPVFQQMARVTTDVFYCQ